MKGNAERLATSAPLRRSWRRPAATAGPGATGSAGPQSPRWTLGRWRRIPARSGCGLLQTPRGTPMAIEPLSLRSRSRWPDHPPGRTRPPDPAWSTTPRHWRGLPEPGRRLWPGTRSRSWIPWATHQWRRRIWWKAHSVPL